MDINEDYQMTKAMTFYQCRPLVGEIARLRAELEAARVENGIAVDALRSAKQWLEGWASAEFHLSVINKAINAIDAARGGK